MKFATQPTKPTTEVRKPKPPAFKILRNHRDGRTAKSSPAPSEMRRHQQAPESPALVLHHCEGSWMVPDLIDVEMSSGSWEWNRMLDEESPFFKNCQEREPEEGGSEQEVAASQQVQAPKRSSIFLPKFKQFTWSNPDTDCSVSHQEIY